MMPLLVRSPASLDRRRSSRERSKRAPGRTCRYSRGTVSVLWFRMSGRASSTTS